MNDERNTDSPVTPEQAPEHGPEFWNRIDAALVADPATPTLPVAAVGQTTPDTTSQMPHLRSLDGRAPGAPTPRTSQAKWPLAAAAMVLVVVGLGFLVARGGSDPATTTEIVQAPSEGADAAAADGSGDDPGDVQQADPADDGAAPDADETNDGDEPSDGDEPAGGASQSSSEPAPATSVAVSDDDADEAAPQASPAAPIPDFAAARGAVGEPDFVPLDQGIPAEGTYLANWPERGLTWYAVSDQDTSCANPAHSEIRYVNASGITQPIRDPQLRFSGEISHFVVRNEQNVAAWVVACGEQLELHIATLEPTGRVDTPTLVWLGEGSTSSALVLWDADEVSLNAIEPSGEAFAVSYNIATGLLSRNGGPPRIMLEAGAPADRSLTALAASPDGGLTYWQGQATPGTVSECAALYGSGRSDMLWLRQGEGQWQPAVPADFPVGSITAAALDSASLQIAFADLCAGSSGRVVVGTQLADGRIGDPVAIDLTAFVPGYAAQLFWVDELTLRIETDNSEFGFGTVRFDYRLDQQVMVQLD